jgi:hypothetical protein
VNGKNIWRDLNLIKIMKFFSELRLNATPRVLRQFAAAWLICFLMLGFRFGLWRHSGAGSTLAAISLVGILGLLRPRALYWPFVVLTTAAFPMGWMMTQLALAVMFYCVLTPLALFFRWRGRDALRLRKPAESTLWIVRKEQTPPEKYLKQF